MKKAFLFFGVCAAMFLASCSKSPSQVVEKFFEGMVKGDSALVKKYGTEEGAGWGMLAMAMMQKELGKGDWSGKAINEEINDDNAIVTLEITHEGKVETQDFSVVKIGGEWKVAGKKDEYEPSTPSSQFEDPDFSEVHEPSVND